MVIILYYVQSVYIARNVISDALSSAIDSAIIYGTIASDVGRGEVRLDRDKVKQGITAMLKANLRLDDSLSSETFRRGKLAVQVTHNSDGVPRVEAEFSAEIDIGIMRLFGQDEYTIRVPRKTPYLTEYK
ncbi:hypothetical protein PPOP_1442 [Paenibacillus popilliae ATCC 14706]|uniref:Uncharacterized protein n=2 Tax=Paenibacillus popilliae TaxID=78057 RepID=M9LH71_PAEPP|nr:hypothetical protein PPOP_1442 [Paenibacillus popilliae ATCC 14706]